MKRRGDLKKEALLSGSSGRGGICEGGWRTHVSLIVAPPSSYTKYTKYAKYTKNARYTKYTHVSLIVAPPPPIHSSLPPIQSIHSSLTLPSKGTPICRLLLLETSPSSTGYQTYESLLPASGMRPKRGGLLSDANDKSVSQITEH